MTDRESYLRFGNGHPFDAHPDFYNHMCHWAPWAEHFRDEKSPTGVLANMLGAALEEIDRLCKRCGKFESAYAILLWAFIDLVETGKPKPLTDGSSPSFEEAFASVKLLNKWRSENKLNIQLVDVT